MKNYPDIRASRLAPWLLLGCLSLFAKTTLAQPTELEVGVRASVTDTTHLWSREKNKLPGDGGHGKLYGILKVEEIKADWKLVKPVDETYITNVLIMEMAKNGFHQIAAGQKPEIIITLSYGRGELANPYTSGQGEVGGNGTSIQVEVNGGGDAGNAPMQTVTGAWADQLYNEKSPGWEAKLQKAAYEKLYLRVTAFSYPAKGEKPRMLWKNVMVVDDPDHRDLNIVAAKMLEAGAPYFDKQPRDKEILTQKPLPTGRVTFGTPEVVEPRK